MHRLLLLVLLQLLRHRDGVGAQALQLLKILDTADTRKSGWHNTRRTAAHSVLQAGNRPLRKLAKRVALPRCCWKMRACCSLKMAGLEEPASWGWLGWAVCWGPAEVEVRFGLKSRCF
jgi:hypothetical protein